MRRALAIAVAVALIAPASAGAASVQVMVVGKERVLRAPKTVKLKVRTVKVGSERCRVAAATPLAALVATKLKLGVRDFGSCSRRPRDAAGLYVAKVGREREKGRGGWVYKVGRRAGSAGAADPSGPFGTGKRLRAGQRITWFWCELNQAGSCQRTLEVQPDRTSAAPGEALRVTVRGYDDQGKGVAVAGATVRLGAASAVTAADGTASLTVPGGSGALRLTAERAGMVRAFPREVAVG
jgi:hypothetical protein